MVKQLSKKGKLKNMVTPTVKFKKLVPQAQIPTYAHEKDSGMDLRAIGYWSIRPGTSALVSTGIAMALPDGYEGQIRPRSGLAAKNNITVLNTPGTIDYGYRSECKVILFNHGHETFNVNEGDRIAQLVIVPVAYAIAEEVSELDETERNTSGFGSTGLK